MFYNTGIATYVWVLSNKKPDHRKGKVQLIDASGLWRKMRKSLGSKRREMGDADIDTVTRLFGDCVEAQLAIVLDADGKETGREVVKDVETPPEAPYGGKVKLRPLSLLLPNEAFGYRQITVERPLKVAFVYEEWSKVEKLRHVKALDLEDQNRLGDTLRDKMAGARLPSRERFIEALEMALQVEGHGHLVDAKLLRAVTDACTVVDPSGEILKDARGQPKPDTSLRDTEIVPLTEDVETYFEREVRPHVPDAWIDHEKTTIGYEIPFNRHFYVFEPPRDLEEIDADLEEVSRKIQQMLAELSA